MEEIIAKQGWNDTTVLALLYMWISANGHKAAFTAYLRAVADAENSEPEHLAKQD